MRITGGRARGISLRAPKGQDTRPATDQLREALFSSLGPRIEGASIADLFAGTGAYGLEALSRGANRGIFVESNAAAASCLRENLAAVTKSAEARSTNWRILNSKVESVGEEAGSFDIIFVDPPYEQIEKRIEAIFSEQIKQIATKETLVCFEMPGNFEIEIDGWKQVRRLGKAGKDKPTVVLFAPENS